MRPRFRLCATMLAAGALITGAAEAAAQKLPVTVRGTIMDSTLSRPLPGVVILLDTGERVRTDGRGNFLLRGVAPGRHRMLIVAAGCRASVAEFEAGTDPDETRRIVVGAAFGVAEPETGPGPPPDSPRRMVTSAEIRAMNAASLVDVIRRIAPYMVSGPGGQAGAGTRLMGRGGRTVADARVPVVIVDGVVLFSEDPALLEGITPADVASLEILPGAVGGWGFGTHGSGGVIRIRTHRGGGPPADADPGSCVVAAAAAATGPAPLDPARTARP